VVITYFCKKQDTEERFQNLKIHSKSHLYLHSSVVISYVFLLGQYRKASPREAHPAAGTHFSQFNNLMFRLPFCLFWVILIEKLYHYLLTNRVPPYNPAKICEAAQNPKKMSKNFSF